ncbi:MAG: aldehyde dehydrogenase family protein [Phycisphaerales bacterium]
MSDRLDVTKTYKLYIGGAFPRSESGRTLPVGRAPGGPVAHVSRASRKDLRDAVEAAARAQPAWAEATAYNRGQVLYRMAEMLEGKKAEFAGLLGSPALRAGSSGTPRSKARGTRKPAAERRATQETAREVEAAIDRLVCFGGWADKYAQVLGCNNPVAGPFYNFTVPEPTGIVGVIAPDAPALLGLVSLIAPPLCAGNAVVALGSETSPLVAAVFAEVCATSDVPPGVLNILTGLREELVPHFSSHREINAIHAAGVSPAHARALREGAADNVKRVTVREGVDWFDEGACHSPWWIEGFVEMKTMWHPSGA